MKNVLAGMAAALLSVPVMAGTCVALDYQEMKDMSADELTVEVCKAHASANESLSEGIENLGRRGPKPYPNADTEFEQCMGQITRIERVLESKGVLKASIQALCEQAGAKSAAR